MNREDLKRQMYRWRSTASARTQRPSLLCINCHGASWSYCKLCLIATCNRCIHKYFNHKDAVVVGVVR